MTAHPREWEQLRENAWDHRLRQERRTQNAEESEASEQRVRAVERTGVENWFNKI